jgi:hypothetical protein
LATATIVPPEITPEENEKRIKELERVLSNIFKCEINVSFSESKKSYSA